VLVCFVYFIQIKKFQFVPKKNLIIFVIFFIHNQQINFAVKFFYFCNWSEEGECVFLQCRVVICDGFGTLVVIIWLWQSSGEKDEVCYLTHLVGSKILTVIFFYHENKIKETFSVMLI